MIRKEKHWQAHLQNGESHLFPDTRVYTRAELDDYIERKKSEGYIVVDFYRVELIPFTARREL